MRNLVLAAILALPLLISPLTTAQATDYAIAAGGSGSGTVSETNPTDWWAVTVPADGELTLTVTQDRDGDLVDIDLYDTDRTTHLRAGTTGNTVETVTMPNLMPGTYHLRIKRWGGDCTYTLQSSFTPNPLPNDPEPNATVAQAVPIDPNGTRTGHIGYYAGGVTDSYDYYKVTVPADGELTLTVTQDRDSDVLDIDLYDTDGTTHLRAGSTGNTVETVTMSNLMPGTYYLRIRLWNAFCGYTIQSRFTPNPLANDPEPNGTITQAVQIDPNGTRTGHIGYYAGGVADRYDYYKVTVPADGELSLSVTQDRDGDILDTYLYDTDGTTELARGYTHNTTETTTVPNLKPGTYYLRIYSFSNGFCGYTIQSRFTPQPLANDVEPNDTLQTAQTVRQDRPVTGHLGYYSAGVTDKDDWFRYVLPADGDFWLTIVTDATLDADVVLYDATGNEIVRDSGSSTTSRVGKDGLRAGVYYLKIYSYWTGYGGYTVTPTYNPFYVNLLGMGQIIPGEEVAYLVRYANPLTTSLENAVVMVDLPLNIDVVNSTGGGIYRADDACRNQVFWKLGTLAPGAGGEVTVTFSVPWGTPFSDKMQLSGAMSASNMTDPPFDVTPYLTYAPNRVTGERNLAAGEVTALLAAQPGLAALYTLMTQEGYLYFGTAVHYSRQDAAEMDRLYLVAPRDGAPTVLTWSGGTAFAELFRDESYSVFDTSGGVTWDRTAQTFVPWGSWTDGAASAARMATSTTQAITGLREARCQFNCTLNSVPDVVAKKVSSIYKNLKFSQNCINCALSIEAGSPDAESCSKCTASGAGKVSKTIATNIPLLGDAISWSWTVKKCFDDCQKDPGKHICTEDKKECDWSVIGWLGGFDTVLTTPCNKTTGTYGMASSRTYCAYGDSCTSGTCGPRPPCTGSTCQEKTVKVRASHDPNAKSVDHKGDVIPGQRLNYTLEYENTGSGDALGVFLMDKLDPNLDETSLSINNGGSYSAATRMLSWDVGDLPAGAKGSVSFGINLKGATVGTEVVNQAKVYFPSALEVTPTNAVVNRLAALTADPKSVTGMTRTAIPVSLSGQSTGMAASYRIVTYPAQGTLTGTAPHLTYTSAPKFSGQDEFTYVTFAGTMESAPARVTVTVTPDPADSSPPTVTGTVPAAGATGVHVSAVPVSTAPDLYLPAIRATFSEAMESATITGDSFTVDGISGRMTYDAVTRTATFEPGAPLGTLATYTVRLTSAIRNVNGTSLAPFSWQFSTESPAHLAIGLPLGVSELLYPDLSVSQVSSPRTVTVTSSGSQDLVLGTVTVTGAGGTNFPISQDLCSGRTLGQGESCSVTVTFAPQVAGDHQARLTLPSNDAANPTATVTLKGSAIALCTLTLNATGSGSGTLLGAGGYVCGQTVPVTATATNGSGFIGWSGDCAGTTAGIAVPMDRNRSCTATFSLIRSLTLDLIGSGGGSVTSTPPGFYCQTGSCTANYYQEESVRLTAAPDKDSLFAGWGGNCTGTGTCLLDFLSNRQVSASFTFVKPVRLLVTGLPDAEYGTLQAAFTAAPSGSAIKARSYTFTGPLTLGAGSAVTFSGGYERDFTTRTGSSFSLLKGVLLIGKGSLKLDRLVIQ